MIDAYLVAVGEGQALALAAAVIIGDRKRLGFSEKHISVIHLAGDPYPTSHRVEIDEGRGRGAKEEGFPHQMYEEMTERREKRASPSLPCRRCKFVWLFGWRTTTSAVVRRLMEILSSFYREKFCKYYYLSAEIY